MEISGTKSLLGIPSEGIGSDEDCALSVLTADNDGTLLRGESQTC